MSFIFRVVDVARALPGLSRRLVSFLLMMFIMVGVLSGCSKSSNEEAASVITVYSARKEHLIKPIFELYTKETGIEVQYITDSAGPLLARLKAEGENSPADLFMTVDAGYLWQASNEGVLAAIDSSIIEANVPDSLRSPTLEWTGLSQRARTMVYAKERVQPEELSTYEALADSKWKGRLCLRTSKKVYNQSLVATMIKTMGEAKTEALIRGWVSNLATEPYSNDTKAMEAVAAGQCDVTIVNTYYFGRLKRDVPDLPLALFWPNQNDRGVHVNVSGAGVTRHAKNPEGAKALLEWMTTPAVQSMFAELNQEYPVNPAVKASEEVRSWGDFKADTVNVEAAGSLQAEAIKLMDRAGYH
ncbi:extracellular solute-binding protein [Marinibactrum halimedae]|nr:extracellular solute-binding protein [Marinibactrum halimedae]MCD9458759.1 extracellular solute-binding protein [Marinibactrum halimedae]